MIVTLSKEELQSAIKSKVREIFNVTVDPNTPINFVQYEGHGSEISVKVDKCEICCIESPEAPDPQDS